MSESSSRRKFRLTDNSIIFRTLEKIIQIKAKIEEECVTKEIDVTDLPMAMIPVHELYNIVACYEAMYTKLQNEELLVTGYPKTPKTYN